MEVCSEKTLPPRSLPMRRMGISLGMRPLLRTTCGGKGGARERGEEGQFSTNGRDTKRLRVETGTLMRGVRRLGEVSHPRWFGQRARNLLIAEELTAKLLCTVRLVQGGWPPPGYFVST